MAWETDALLALALSRPAVALTEARAVLAAGPSAAEAATAHQAVGVVLRDFGDIAAAIMELRTAQRYARKAGDPSRTADIGATLGVARVMAGQSRRGLQILDGVVEGSAGAVRGRILIRRAYTLWLLGRNHEALHDARAAVALLGRAGDTVWEARAVAHRAVAYMALGAVEKADRDYARAETLFAEAGQLLEYADVRQERGEAAFARGDLPAALGHFDHAQQLVDELGVFEPELVVNKCTVLLAAGLAGEALEETNEAVARMERQRGSATRRAELLHSAALAAYATGDLDEAGRRSTDALRLFRGQGRGWWAAHAELVLLQCRWARDEGASRALVRWGERVCRDLDGFNSSLAVDAHLLTGRLALRRSDLPAARLHLTLAAAARGTGLRTRIAGWLARAMLCQLEGHSRGMLAACERGLQQLDLYLRTLGATELRVLATGQGSELASMALRHALGRSDARQVLRWSERWRAVALAVSPVRPPEDGELATDLAALRHMSRRLEASSGQRGLALTALEREQRRLETDIRRRVLRTPGVADRAPARLRCADLLEQLGPAYLIELTDVDGDLYAVVVGRGRVRLERVGATTAAERSLTHALFALRREGTRRGEYRLDLDEIGRRLESDLLGSCVSHLHSAPVVVVPTGRLHAVPWSLLPSFRDRPTSVMPSASAWLRAKQVMTPGAPKVVLVGGPELSTGNTEIDTLARAYPEALVLRGQEASVENVLSTIDGAWLVHIAAHGTFRADSPLFSAIRLDDGPLTVYDLERLRQAPLRVVLSSCSSAIGAPTGADELLGFVSALISLGSTGIVASVVPVSDPATVPLMLELHGQLRQGFPLAQALFHAQRTMGEDRAAHATAQSFLAFGV